MVGHGDTSAQDLAFRVGPGCLNGIGWVVSRLEAAGRGAWRNLGDNKGLVGIRTAELELKGEILESLKQAVKQGLVEMLRLHALGPEAMMGELGQLGPSRKIGFFYAGVCV